MRDATTRRAAFALSAATLLVALTAPAGAGAARAPRANDPVRWTLSLVGTVSSQRESTTITTSPAGCSTEVTDRTAELWRWRTPARVTIEVRRDERGRVELSRGVHTGVIQVPVLASLAVTSTRSTRSTGPAPDCSPGSGLSGYCPSGRSDTGLSVSVRWNPGSRRLELGPPAGTPQTLGMRIGGCGAGGDPASLLELPFGTLTARRPVTAPTLLSAAGPFAREALSEIRRREPEGARETRSSRVLVRLTPAG